MDRPVYRKYDEQETDNITLDESLGVQKALLYGWDGTNAVAIKVDDTGKVVLNVI